MYLCCPGRLSLACPLVLVEIEVQSKQILELSGVVVLGEGFPSDHQSTGMEGETWQSVRNERCWAGAGFVAQRERPTTKTVENTGL